MRIENNPKIPLTKIKFFFLFSNKNRWTVFIIKKLVFSVEKQIIIHYIRMICTGHSVDIFQKIRKKIRQNARFLRFGLTRFYG